MMMQRNTHSLGTVPNFEFWSCPCGNTVRDAGQQQWPELPFSRMTEKANSWYAKTFLYTYNHSVSPLQYKIQLLTWNIQHFIVKQAWCYMTLPNSRLMSVFWACIRWTRTWRSVGVLKVFLTWNISSLQWVYLDITPLKVKED